MFLRCKTRKKNGKEHRGWSIVESRRLACGRVVQRHVLYLGEINDSQEAAWRKSIELFAEEEPHREPITAALFPEDRAAVVSVAQEDIVHLRLGELKLCRPRQWGACWLALHLWRELGLDGFWAARLPVSRKGTRWDAVLAVLTCYRLLSPGSEWRLHREWFLRSALADLLGADFSLAEEHRLYECHDKLLAHKTEFSRGLAGQTLLQFEWMAGTSYVIEYTSNLRSGVWMAVPSPGFTFPAPGRCQWIDDGTLTGGLGGKARFYRVRQQSE